MFRQGPSQPSPSRQCRGARTAPSRSHGAPREPRCCPDQSLLCSPSNGLPGKSGRLTLCDAPVEAEVDDAVHSVWFNDIEPVAIIEEAERLAALLELAPDREAQEICSRRTAIFEANAELDSRVGPAHVALHGPGAGFHTPGPHP